MGITSYLSETIFIISVEENIVKTTIFLKLLEISYGSDILVSFTNFQDCIFVYEFDKYTL